MARVVPAIVPMVRPGLTNCTLWTTKLTISTPDEGQQRPGEDVDRLAGLISRSSQPGLAPRSELDT